MAILTSPPPQLKNKNKEKKIAMAETERPHRSSSINSSNNANTPSSTDLFSCFTSRFSSSSSMRLSSLSPARSACLTTSLSRRLRTSGSLKNASAGAINSPMFGANGRKRSGSGYENNNNNIEPSSPKVTCIGQVRVKTRKHAKKKKMRARSRRRGGGGDTSLRRSSFDQNDGGGCRLDASSENRWVHLPVAICESLRSFGSELNCFVPCRSSCTGNNNSSRHRDGDRDGCGGGNGCGFARWFVAVEETGGKRREIELVVGGGEEDAEEDRRRSRRRHVFEGIDLGEIATEKKEREEIGRISLCTPPKNALLLMRCRSDPVKVAALANRVRERQMLANDEEEDEERRRLEIDLEDKKRIELCEKWISGEKTVAREVVEDEAPLESNPPKEEEIVQVLKDSAKEEEESAKIQKVDSFEEEILAKIIINIEDNIRNAIEEEHITEMEEEEEEEVESKEVATATPNVESSKQGNREPDPSPEVMIRRNQQEEKEKKPYKVLPDSLLLMMCEPKLSMEVSKETWVCSTDFARSLPRRPQAKKKPEATGDHHHQQQQPKKRIISAVESNASSRRRSIDRSLVHQAMLQPSRSSCSYPDAPPIIAAVGEQKLAGVNKAFEPPVLPHCKSEFMGRLLDEFDMLQRRAQAVNLDIVDAKVSKLMPELGFAPEDADRLVASFSGGWQMRMSLGTILFQDPDLLLLDEPTNHLDLDTIE